jgi:hypothetical protein
MTTTKPKRHRLGDRILAPGAARAEIECDYALAPFDRAAREIEGTWGIDVLETLVAPSTAARFGSLIAALNAAIDARNPQETARLAEIGQRAYAAMDAEARAAGHAPKSPAVMCIEVEGQKYAVIHESTEWTELPGHKTVTLRELIVTFRRLPSAVMAARDAFPGATVAGIRPKEQTQLEKDLDDEIPF